MPSIALLAAVGSCRALAASTPQLFALRALAAAWARPARAQRALSSSASGSSGGAGSTGGSDPAAPADVFTASLQQKTEEELRQMVMRQTQQHSPPAEAQVDSGTEGAEESASSQPLPPHGKREIGGYKGPEPTRYQDWEIKGRCSDF